MRQRGLRALELRQQVRQLGVRVEQVVGDEHRSFAFGGEHAVVDDAFRIRVEIPRHARIRSEQSVHSLQRRFGQFHGGGGTHDHAEAIVHQLADALAGFLLLLLLGTLWAARLARALDRWQKLAPPYREAAREAIARVAAKTDLSNDVREVVTRALADGTD